MHPPWLEQPRNLQSTLGSQKCMVPSSHLQACYKYNPFGYVAIEIIFYCIGNSPWCIYKGDWLFNTQSRILQADWLELENYEKATLNINMPYYSLSTKHYPAKVRYIN